MASKELIAQAAKATEERRKELIAQPLSRIYPQLAEAAISTILAALQEPTREMLDELKINDAFTYQALETRWNAALNASPLGEQSE